MRVVDIRLKDGSGAVKAFVDCEVDTLQGPIVIRNMKLVQEQEGFKPYVTGPSDSWKGPNGQTHYSHLVILPKRMKTELDILILSAWQRAKEIENGRLIK